MNNSPGTPVNNLSDSVVFSLCTLSNLSQLFVGESVEDIQSNTQTAITSVLADSAVSGIIGNWQVVWLNTSISLHTSQNCMYIACNSSGDTPVYVIGISGTNGANTIDIIEDLGGLVADSWDHFPNNKNPLSGNNPKIAGGFKLGLDILIGMSSVPLSGGGTSAVTAAQYLSNAGASNVYITGHSLGGTLANLYALYLYSQNQSLNIQCLALAALSAGDADFNTYYNSIPMLAGNTTMYWNTLDFYPSFYVHSLLENVKTLYAPDVNWDLTSAFELDPVLAIVATATDIHKYYQLITNSVKTFTSDIYTSANIICKPVKAINPEEYIGQATCQHVPAYAYQLQIIPFLVAVTNVIQANQTFGQLMPCTFFTDGFSEATTER